jgi:hypothetical protein
VQCRNWSPFLSNFLNHQPTSENDIWPKVARNAINLQVIIDPLTPVVRHLVHDLLSFFMRSAPVRIGVLFIAPNATASESRLGLESTPAKLTSQELFVRCESSHVISVAASSCSRGCACASAFIYQQGVVERNTTAATCRNTISVAAAAHMTLHCMNGSTAIESCYFAFLRIDLTRASADCSHRCKKHLGLELHGSSGTWWCPFRLEYSKQMELLMSRPPMKC